jgi:glycogen synthase
MKVLMTADPIGGVWTYALELARSLRAHDVEIVLATQGARPDSAQRSAVAALDNIVVEESAYRLEWMPEPWHDLRRGDDWLLDLEARHSPDVVHLNDLTRGALSWRAPKLVVGHSCVLSWWLAMRRVPAPATWARYRRVVARSLAGADIVIAPSAAMLAALRSHYGRGIRGHVIANGRAAARFPVLDKEPFVFGAGRIWDEGKNLASLGRAAAGIPWPVFIAGSARPPDGGGEADAGSACLVGQLDERALARWYGAATIYALPARYEPFGLSALEAALAGCVLVLGDIASLRGIWRDAALFVDPFDDAALVHALARLIDDAGLRRELMARSRIIALSHSARRMAERYLATYHRLAAKAGDEQEAALCAS